MTLRNILTKLGKILPLASFGLGAMNYGMGREAKAARLNYATSENKRLLLELQNKDNLIINNQDTIERISSLSADAVDQLGLVKHHSNVLNQLANRLNDPNITEAERNFIIKTMQTNNEQHVDSLEKANSILQKIIDVIISDNPGNNLFPQFTEIIEAYKDFLSTITFEQHIPLLNILGLIFIFSCLISLAGVVFSDYLVKYFNLTNKYPRIENFIQMRRKFQ
jgi:hypothetical protein